MPLTFYNTRTRRLEAFAPAHPPRVTMYVCGPTVYDEPHIGHARSAYVFDVIRRWLEYRRYEVDFVRNITDVDDKIIQRAQQDGRPPEAVATASLQAYHAALERLGIPLPAQEPRATQYIDQMTDLIGKLIVNGIAYEAKDGVYFAVKQFPGYGRLSNRTLEEMRAGARVEPGEGKRDPLDFALWKTAKPGEPSWSSPWGAGRPGWHVECSAMSMHCLGAPQIDIHGGGLDLIFPHHENEIAQSEAASGKSPFAKYWLHHGLLTINGQKMSKSLGNFVTVQDALKQCGDQPDVLKEFFLNAHYRSPLDYSDSSIRMSLERLNGWLILIKRAEELERKGLASRETASSMPVPKEFSDLEDQFGNAMDNDLNTPEALAVLDGIVHKAWGTFRQTNPWEPPQPIQYKHPSETFNKILYAAQTLRRLGKVLGLFEQHEALVVTAEQQSKIDERKAARKRKDFKTADRIRDEFRANGFILEDTDQGPIIRRER